MKPLIKLERPKRQYYAINVNMSLSFDRLKAMAEKLLGAEVELGDVLICDNANQTKRKVLQMTSKGMIIYYGRLDHRKTFTPLATKDGKLGAVEGVL